MSTVAIVKKHGRVAIAGRHALDIGDCDESTGGPVESHVIPLTAERAAEEEELLLMV